MQCNVSLGSTSSARLPCHLPLPQNSMPISFLREVINAGVPKPANISDNVHNGSLQNITNEFVIALLWHCHKRVSRCFCCSNSLKYREDVPPPLFDFVIVAKMKREYFNQGVKCVAAPSNVYFHACYDNPFCNRLNAFDKSI